MKIVRKFFLYLVLLLLISSNIYVSPSYSQELPIKLYLNNEEIHFDVPPTVVDGRILVPARGIFEILGATVKWDQDTNTAIIIKDHTKIQLQIGSKNAIINGNWVELDIPPAIINERILIPVRFVSENLGANVAWDSENNTITITEKPIIEELNNIPNDKIRNGFDKYIWNNGTTYEGNWKNNKIDGIGTIGYANGDQYSGSFTQNKKNGYGVFTWANKESYKGEWVNDKMNGYGVYLFKNGDVYNGNWSNNKMDGQGTYMFKDGRTLTGTWKESKCLKNNE